MPAHQRLDGCRVACRNEPQQLPVLLHGGALPGEPSLAVDAVRAHVVAWVHHHFGGQTVFDETAVEFPDFLEMDSDVAALDRPAELAGDRPGRLNVPPERRGGSGFGDGLSEDEGRTQGR